VGHAGGLRPNYARHDEVPRRLAAVARTRSDVRPAAEGAFLPVVLVLALSSAVMLIRLVSSPPTWMTG
jgi:hypothetical protein